MLRARYGIGPIPFPDPAVERKGQGKWLRLSRRFLQRELPGQMAFWWLAPTRAFLLNSVVAASVPPVFRGMEPVGFLLRRIVGFVQVLLSGKA